MKLLKKLDDLISEAENAIETKFDAELDKLLALYESFLHADTDEYLNISWVKKKLAALIDDMTEAGVYKILESYPYGYTIKTFVSKSSADAYSFAKANEIKEDWEHEFPGKSIVEDSPMGLSYAIEVEDENRMLDFVEFFKLYHNDDKATKEKKKAPAYKIKDGHVFLDLYTTQSVEAYDSMMKKGILVAPKDKQFLFPWLDGYDPWPARGYNWMAREMKEHLPAKRPKNVEYPVWAWYKNCGYYGRPDLMALEDTFFSHPSVMIHFEAPLSECMLSDYDKWCYSGPFNCGVDFKCPAEWDDKTKDEVEHNILMYVGSNAKTQEQAWESAVLVHGNGTKDIASVQVCLWKIKKEWVKDVEDLTDEDAKFRNFCLI